MWEVCGSRLKIPHKRLYPANERPQRNVLFGAIGWTSGLNRMRLNRKRSMAVVLGPTMYLECIWNWVYTVQYVHLMLWTL